VSGVPDGRGGLLGSGTNAPLYTTTFSARPKAEEDLAQHEHRLAEALGLDRVARVLEFRADSSKRPNSTSKRDIKTVWMGTEWITHEAQHSTYISSQHTSLNVIHVKVDDIPLLTTCIFQLGFRIKSH
jgi:meiosis-specific APC/C activator protein AMA1